MTGAKWDPVLELQVKECCEALVSVVKSFAVDYRTIFMLRFGLIFGYCYTFKEIERVVNSSGCRIMQKVAAGLKRIEEFATITDDGRLKYAVEYGVENMLHVSRHVLSVEEAIRIKPYDTSSIYLVQPKNRQTIIRKFHEKEPEMPRTISDEAAKFNEHFAAEILPDWCAAGHIGMLTAETIPVLVERIALLFPHDFYEACRPVIEYFTETEEDLFKSKQEHMVDYLRSFHSGYSTDVVTKSKAMFLRHISRQLREFTASEAQRAEKMKGERNGAALRTT